MRPLCYDSQSASNESIQPRLELNRDKATGIREQRSQARLTQPEAGTCFSKRHERGLTLIELLVTLLVLSMSLGLAIPQLRQMIDANKERAATHQIMAVLATARLTALTRSTTIGICDFGELKCAASWRTLSLVERLDSKKMTRHTFTPTFLTLPRELVAIWRGFRRRKAILYQSTGALDSDNGRIVLCHTGNQRVRFEIVVSASGRPRIISNNPVISQRRYQRYCSQLTIELSP